MNVLSKISLILIPIAPLVLAQTSDEVYLRPPGSEPAIPTPAPPVTPALDTLPKPADNTPVQLDFQMPPPATIEPPRTPSGDTLIAQVQRYLSRLGLDPGPVDGAMGQKTRTAIREFQNAWGLAVDGEISADLLRELEQAAPR